MGDRSLTVLTTTFSRAMALSMRAFCAAVSLRAGRTSSGFFFLPTRGRPKAVGRQGGCDEGCQQQTGGGVFPEDHDLRLLR